MPFFCYVYRFPVQKVFVMPKHVQKQSRPVPSTWYGRLPVSIMRRVDLSTSAKLVFAAISAHVWQGDTAKVGQRRLASLTGLALSTVNSAIKELVDVKAIVPMGEGQRRRMYVLLSPVFGQKQGKMDVIVSGPSGVPRYASMEQRTA